MSKPESANMSGMGLTIAIPTYNRNVILAENLKFLLPQLTPDHELLIVDNHSDIPVAETLKDLLAHYTHLRIRMVRNRANIGGNTNILRCLELCDTEWLWVLGDDDRVKPDALAIISDHLRLYPDCLFINFSTNNACLPPRERVVITKGLQEFVEKLDSIGSVGFISTGVIKVTPLLPYLRFAHLYQYSCLPLFTTILLALHHEEKCCLSDHIIISTIAELTPIEDSPSNLIISLGMVILLDLPIDSVIRERLKKQFIAWINNTNIARQIFMQLLLLFMKEKDHGTIDYYYQSIYNRIYVYDRTLTGRLEKFIYKYMLKFPRISYKLISCLYRLFKNKEFGTHLLIDAAKR